MIRRVALYRALNVGHRRIAMDRLRRVHEGLGHTEVRTHLASGNVLFASVEEDIASLSRELEAAFERESTFRSEVVLRSADQLRTCIRTNPFLGGDRPPKLVHTLFLAQPPAPATVSGFLRAHRGPEQVEVVGEEAYVYYPEGMARSKLDLTKLGVIGTARNANTVQKLLELLEG